MAIEWKAISGHMRLGVEFRTDPYDTNTASITAYADVWLEVGYPFRYDDDQYINYAGQFGAGTYNFHNYQAASGTHQFKVFTLAIGGQGQSYGGGPTYGLGLQLGGAYDGSAPTGTWYFSLPPRPPNVPGVPPTWIDQVTSSGFRVNVGAADPRGAAVDQYEVIVGTNTAYSPLIAHWYGGSGVVSGATRATRYWVAARAHNAVEWGAWTTNLPVDTLATVPDQITSLALSANGPTSITASWTSPNTGGSPITSYTIQLSTDPTFLTAVQTYTSASASQVINDLTPGLTYYARVWANNGVGSGVGSAVQSITLVSGVKLMIAPGQSKNAAVRIRREGVWVVGKVHVGQADGTWS